MKHADVFMKPRVNYIIEVLRQMAQSSPETGVVAVVDHDMLPFIEQAWQTDLPRELRSLDSLQRIPALPDKLDPKKSETFLQFVEKQVILDVMLEPYLQRSFIQYDAFPYTEKGFLASETAQLNVITFWRHYWHKYMDQMQEATILEDEYQNYLQAEGIFLKD